MNKQEKAMGNPEVAIQADASSLESIGTWRQQLARVLLRALAVVGALTVLAASYDAYTDQIIWQIPIYVSIYAVLIVVTFWRRVPYQVQIPIVIALLIGFGAFNLTQFGLNAESALLLLTVPFIGALFFGIQGGRLTIAAVILVLAIIAWLFVTDRVVVHVTEPVRSTDLDGWVTMASVFLMLSVLVVFGQNYLLERLVAALNQSRRLALELEAERTGLETTVKERTHVLEQRSTYLEASAEVARAVGSILEINELIRQVAELIRERFDLYYVGLFLLDESGQWAVLRAATGAAGRAMLARGHRIQVGKGMIGWSVVHAQPRVALEAGADAVRLATAELPETRSEAALPLRSRGQVLGALSVQSTQPGAFDEEALVVLQTMADQVTVALDNAQLFAASQAALEAERRAYGELGRQAWAELLRLHADRGYRYLHGSTTPTTDDWRPDMRQTVQTNQVVHGNSSQGATLSIPIKVRDQVIAVLGLRKDTVGEAWTTEEVTLLEALAEQLGVALDSARLYQDTQRRAAQEQLVGEATTRMRESLDVDAVLQTAVHEMGQALRLHDVTIQLGADAD